jgi:ankyrin repeat protein
MLIANGANVNARDTFQNKPLHNACKSTSTSIVFPLLATGADVTAMNTGDLTPEAIATKWNKSDVVNLLKAKQANENPYPPRSPGFEHGPSGMALERKRTRIIKARELGDGSNALLVIWRLVISG